MMTFTSPGKLGDCLHQFPVAFWWHREHQKPFDFWMDEKTCKILESLIAVQPGVEHVRLLSGIESYHCGGQPWNFNLDPKEYEGRSIVHLGLRSFPKRQLTLEAFQSAKLDLHVPQDELANTPCFVIPEPLPPANRLLLHGMAVCPHTGRTPEFWPFLFSIREWTRRFDEVVWIGSPRDRETGMAVYPKLSGQEWSEFDDQGDMLDLARYMQASKMVISCGSSMAAMAGSLKVPCVRVHDPIGQAPKVIWDNLGHNQLNASEFELRTMWPEFRDRILGGE